MKQSTSRIVAASAVLTLAAGWSQGLTRADTAAGITPVKTEAPAGAYALDKAHTSLLFRVDHIGFSNWTARFKRLEGQLELDPAKPADAKLDVTVDAASIETDVITDQFDFNAILRGPEWLDTAKFPDIAFRSTAIALTGPKTARITGDFSLHGVTKPITLEATFNGGYAGHAYEPNARIGFSARGTLKRSEFGIAYGLPPPGTTMGVGDAVEVIVETELTGPPMKGATAPAQ